MKQLLITIAAVVLVGCGESQQTVPAPEAKPIARVAGAKAPDISIHDAAKKGNIEAVKQHLATGTDVNAKDIIGDTALHFAAFEGHTQIAKLLMDKGAYVNAKNPSGWTSLDMAISRKHPETSDLIRKNGGKTRKELKAAGN